MFRAFFFSYYGDMAFYSYPLLFFLVNSKGTSSYSDKSSSYSSSSTNYSSITFYFYYFFKSLNTLISNILLPSLIFTY